MTPTRRRARLPALALTCTLACVLVLAGCGTQPSPDASGDEVAAATSDQAPEPAPATTEPSTSEIPDDFPLSAGMGGPQDTIATLRTGTGLRDLELCGTAPLRGLGSRDRMIADNSGGESADTRELLIFGSPEEAVVVARALTDLPRSCATPTRSGGMDTSTEVRASAFGPAPAATLLQTYAFDGEAGSGATIIHVVPVGPALLVTSTYGEWPGGAPTDGIAQTVEALQQPVAAMQAFDDSSGTAAIPSDFPLAAGLPEGDEETEVSAPSADGDGVGEVEMCGQVTWPADDTGGGTERLATSALGPEYFDGRELLVHADADAAVDAMTAIRRAARECRTFDNQVWTRLERDTGYDTVTMGLTYDDGLGSSVLQVTRVGSARLMVQTYGEGSLASLEAQADAVTGTTKTIVPAMCVFTRTGC